MSDSDGMNALVALAARGDQKAAAALFARFHERLLKMVRLRMDRRLQGRVDSEDVLQETYLDASRRLPTLADNPPASFFLWLRFLAAQKLIDARRHHLGADKRNAGLEVSLYRGPMPEATSASLAAQLLGRLTSPSFAAVRAETQLKVQEVLNSMDPIDREVLVLRHFEHLSNNETAELLGITKAAASKRYVSALRRLKETLKGLPGFDDRF
ncbi:MAG TPA: sigma-70 family RNA polymerase sigma factor [Gemmataceae bacterium]|nr:sigma-70 family RNA polymerase sigma factor [Gemmataceae bacterium]